MKEIYTLIVIPIIPLPTLENIGKDNGTSKFHIKDAENQKDEKKRRKNST